jgi:transposase InsO family protein
MDFIETVTLSGQRQDILAVIHRANRRAQVLGTTAHPTHTWVTQALRNLVKDLENTEQPAAKFLIRDRDTKYSALINEILSGAGITTVLTGIQMPRMNAHCERIIQTLRHELCDRLLVLNEAHARRLLASYQRHYNDHRPHQVRNQLSPDSDQQSATIHDLQPHRLQRTRVLGGLINEHRYIA